MQKNLVFKIQTKRTKVISCRREASSHPITGPIIKLDPLEDRSGSGAHTVGQDFSENNSKAGEGLQSHGHTDTRTPSGRRDHSTTGWDEEEALQISVYSEHMSKTTNGTR